MQLSYHASQRTRQRGVRPETVGLIFEHADRETFVGSGAVHIFVSRAMIHRLRRMGYSQAECSQLITTSLLLDPDTNTVITALRGDSRARRIKRYRRGRYGWLS